MEIYLTVTGTGDVVSRFNQLEFEVMELVSPVVDKEYGSTLEFIGISVALQDTGLIKLGTRVFRKRKEAAVDVELSKQWAKSANDAEIRLAILECVVQAIDLVEERLTKKEDDFDGQALVADLQPLITKAREKAIGEGGQVDKSNRIPQQRQAERIEGAEGREFKTLIVQYRTRKGSSRLDLEVHRVEDVLDESLKRTDNGCCDGNDMGSGTTNIFLQVKDPQRAVKTITEALNKIQRLNGATIALETEEGFEVLWPQSFRGEFNYSY